MAITDRTTEKDQAEAGQQPDEDKDARQDTLDRIGQHFAGERTIYIADRRASGVETRWIEDIEFYHGRDSIVRRGSLMENIERTGGNTAQTRRESETRSRVFVNITRPKTLSAAARISDMLLPVDDKNWGIRPTPVPELAAMGRDTTPIVSNGAPVMMTNQEGEQKQMTIRDYMDQVSSEANERAKRMEDEINDQLTESDYNDECRDTIFGAAYLGTGIIKGPIVRNRMRKAWIPQASPNGEAIHALQMHERKRPASKNVDPWDFFPDMACGKDIQNAEAIWEREYMTARALRQLAKAPDYIPDQIRAAIEEGPQKVDKNDRVTVALREAGFQLPNRDHFEVWTRWGDFNREVFEACGCDLTGYDELKTFTGCIVMVNDHVIKAYLHPLETGDMPYDIYVWEESDYSVFGYGVPFMLRQASQRILNASVRQMMDHGGVSVGPQVVVKRSVISPADGDWTIRGRKLWFANEDGGPVGDAFSVHEIQSHIKDYAAIIEFAMKMADEEVAFPMIMAGETGGAPHQVGSMQMLMNAASVVLRRLVKRFDDKITRRHIGRYYDYNMQYSKRPEIKGDFEIDARGSTTLLQRDLMNQAIIKWIAALANPALGWLFDAEKLLKKALQADYINPDDVMPEQKEIDRRRESMKNKKPEVSPDTEAKVLGDLKRTEMQEKTKQQAIAQGAQDKKDQREMDLLTEALWADQQTRELFQRGGISQDQLKVKLAETAMKIRADNEAAARGAKEIAIT